MWRWLLRRVPRYTSQSCLRHSWTCKEARAKTLVEVHGTQLDNLGEWLEQVEMKVSDQAWELDELRGRIAKLESRARE